MPAPATWRGLFYRVLSEAIDDLLEHGFDSKERLEYWLIRLKSFATQALIPESALHRQLRDALGQVFKRTISSGNLLRHHVGISEFTVNQIKPHLRSELDRRIMASASLITLNREASVQRTLQRFAGWASSIPAGGTDVAKRGEVKQTVRRGIAGLPFEERRVIIDQGHKLAAAVNDIVATDGGAIVMTWHHVKEGPPAYDARPDHVARDGRTYLIRDSWAHKAGFVKPGRYGYADQITQPAEEPFCRCWGQYGYALRHLPPDMLTAKGKQELEKIRHVA